MHADSASPGSRCPDVPAKLREKELRQNRDLNATLFQSSTETLRAAYLFRRFQVALNRRF